MTIISPELTSHSHQCYVLTISYENSRFTGRHKNKTVLSIVDIDISSYIENKKNTVTATIDIVLLFFNRINFSHLKHRFFI